MIYYVHSKPNCSHCVRAKAALEAKGLPYEEVLYDTPDKLTRFVEMGFRSFPQVYHNGEWIGGADQLIERLKAEATT